MLYCLNFDIIKIIVYFYTVNILTLYKKCYNFLRKEDIMKVKNLNSSSRKTRKLIKETFAELIAEKKSLSNITVTELVKRADITRSSFYTHYDSIYDVAQDIQNETLDLLSSTLEQIQSIPDVYNYLDQIFIYIKENENIYSTILSSNEPLYFSNRLNILINKTLQEALINSNHADLILKVTFFTDGCMDLITKYFRKEINNSLEDINKFIKELFKKIFL